MSEVAEKNPPNLAPYKIFKENGKWVVKNNKGEVKARFDSRAAALKYQRALYVNVKGAPGKAEKKKWTGDQKRASAELENKGGASPMLPPMDQALLALHDELLVNLPEGASHVEEECPFCSPDGGEGMSDRTFSEEELQAAVDRAVADATTALNAKITELEAGQQTKALEDAVAAAKAEMQEQVDELQTKLDTAVLEAQQAKEAKDAVQAAWDQEKADAEAAETLAARKDERLEKVKEVACFPDEYLEKNADRFAAMSDDDFEARLEEWKAISKTETIPKKTALHASRDGNGDSKSNNGSMLGELRNLRVALADPTL